MLSFAFSALTTKNETDMLRTGANEKMFVGKPFRFWFSWSNLVVLTQDFVQRPDHTDLQFHNHLLGEPK